MKTSTLFLSCCLFFPHLSAQVATPEGKEQRLVYPQKTTPTGIDNYLFTAYFHNGKESHNLLNRIRKVPGTVYSLKVNPSGSSYAVIYGKKDKRKVIVYDLWLSQKVIHRFSKGISAQAICYAPDAKTFAIACPDNKVLLYDTGEYELKKEITLPATAERIAISSNNYFLAASNGNNLVIWNLESETERTTLPFGAAINSFEFSNDGSQLAVTTADGRLTVFDTRTYTARQSYEGMGKARSCYFHPERKYIAAVTGDNRISIINLFDDADRHYIDNPNGGITDVRFVKDGKKETYLVYNTRNSIVYEAVANLAPCYSSLIADEVNDRMNEWMKMKEGETMEQYNLRVNDRTRAEQQMLFEQEIATRMAENLVDKSEVSFGQYNPTSQMLAIDFDAMPPIYLPIPTEEVSDFMDPGNLEFRNAVYGVNSNDEFELIYADVYNKASGKTYTFDNLERKSLDYMKSEEDFVPLEMVQQSNMDEIKLQEIKDDIVKTAKENNSISDHTNISVDAGIVAGVDANGNKIMNYKIDYSYTVDEEFSAKEDFKPGKYITEESPAALSMASIMQQAFKERFSQYIKEGKKLEIKISGVADASPIRGKIAYDGHYGEFTNEPVYKDGNLSNITVTKKSGITANEQLAFLRAAGVKSYIEKNIPELSKMSTDYEFHIDVSEKAGSEYRRISVEVLFIDAL